jgi:UDP-N-acetylglucosamine 2-epimerase
MKIVSIVGARPQFIKCAALTQELRTEHNEIIVHTGQHYDFDLSGVFFDELNIPKPDYNLGVGSGTHGYQIGQMLMAIEEVLLKEEPELTLVYGDTNTTLAGALAASKLHIPLGHVEAGLRYLDRSMPEEINRILTDHCSDLLFCPTKTSVNNLYKENISHGVYLTGDVMVDILLRQKEIAEKSNVLQALGLKSKQYLVITVHRAGNTDNRENLQSIVNALCQIDQTMVFPLHPRTGGVLKRYGFYDKLKGNRRIKIVKPLAYFDFLKLMNHAQKILTDSGGIQKEAYVLKVPCITLLETTGWDETIEDGWNVLVGVNTDKIVNMARDFEPRGEQREDFGGGEACKNIRNAIDSALE